jgi:hypothetical protein
MVRNKNRKVGWSIAAWYLKPSFMKICQFIQILLGMGGKHINMMKLFAFLSSQIRRVGKKRSFITDLSHRWAEL